MGGRYLTDLADVLRRAGLTVTEVDGWQTRSRSSGGYDSGRPTHVMVHHTASGPSSDGWPDVNYMTYSSDNRPVANLYVNRAGAWWVMAAGATNTNGKGGPVDGCPADSMNTHAIGIEAGNNGTGEPWPPAQQEAYTTAVAALCDAYDIPTGRVLSHAEWAPDRKIDPAGPSRWAPSGTWPMDPFRADVAAGWPGGHEPEPDDDAPNAQEDEPMFLIKAAGKGTALVAQNGAGVTFTWVQSADDERAFGGAGIKTCTVTPAQFDAFRNAAGAPEQVALVE
jgi:hypothetical protein